MHAPRLLRTLFAAGAALALGVGSAYANGATYAGSGSDVYPIENHQVSMRRELIRLTPSGVDAGWSSEAVEFDCTFWFVNHGDSTTVPMGFPLTADASATEAVVDSSSLRFQVEIDGVPSSYRSAEDGNILLWPVRFRAGQERRVRVRYTLLWSSSDMALYPESMTYVLTTGALWRDPIERSDVVFECGSRMPQVALSLEPPPTRRDRAGVWWEFRNVRPQENLTVRFSSELAQAYDGRFTESWTFAAGRDARASRELLELIDGEWEEGIEYDLWDRVDTLFHGNQDMTLASRKQTLAQRAEIADSAAAWSERLGLRARSKPGISPIEQLNLDYARAVERACRPERPLAELLADIREIHERFW